MLLRTGRVEGCPEGKSIIMGAFSARALYVSKQRKQERHAVPSFFLLLDLHYLTSKATRSQKVQMPLHHGAYSSLDGGEERRAWGRLMR